MGLYRFSRHEKVFGTKMMGLPPIALNTQTHNSLSSLLSFHPTANRLHLYTKLHIVSVIGINYNGIFLMDTFSSEPKV